MPFRRLRSAVSAGALLFAAALAACAAPASGGSPALNAADDTNDPFEPVNRVVFRFDISLDSYVIKPVAQSYHDVVPNWVRQRVVNVLDNVKAPLVLTNDILQGNGDRAGETYKRIWMNTILGIGGLFDVATDLGVPSHQADFGQTFGAWGVPPGPYLVLPLLFSSDPRDAIGYGVESLLDPFDLATRAHGLDALYYSRAGADLLSQRAQHLGELEEVRESSLDFYAAVRSLYQQKRTGDVQAAKSPESQGISYDDPVDAPAGVNLPVPATGSRKAE